MNDKPLPSTPFKMSPSKLLLTENEKRDLIRCLEANQPLPEKYRFLLFKQNREVELVWRGKTDEVSQVALPFQRLEHIDEPRDTTKLSDAYRLLDTSGKQIASWTNKLIWGDNKLILSSLKNGPIRKDLEAQGGLKLIYIDPPFDVGADFCMDIEIGEEKFEKKPSVIEKIAYRDTWGKGADSFIAMIYERLKLMHDLLAEDGSIYVHCDYRVSSYLRLVLDEIFGADNFRNEIIWYYANGGGRARTWFNRKHDTLFWYVKSNKKYMYNGKEAGDERNTNEGTFAGYFKTNEEGRRYQEVRAGGKVYRYYNDELKNADDVWNMGIISQRDKTERINYPTQKPEALLERIIKASSKQGDLVADFFCGSGTTLAVAEKLGRKWIGADWGRFGIHTTRKRIIGVQRELKKAGKNFRAFEILNLGKYERANFLRTNGDLRAEEQAQPAEQKEQEFINLILSEYKAEAVESFTHIVGK
ncbi:MAG: site-specific DNA-methyltransferase, partial [Gammaproteobacteria bacterium]|nr:site-specific DNA-methyltransferase [Gammaproteobacteria bacterium]